MKRMKHNKGKRWIGSMAIVLSCSILLAGCGEAKKEYNSTKKEMEETKKQAENPLNMVMGGKQKPCEMVAEAIAPSPVDEKYKNEIKQILVKDENYGNVWKQICKEVKKALLGNASSDFYKENGVYISKTPVFGWLADSERIYQEQANLMIFSKDFEQMAMCELQVEEEGYCVESVRDIDFRIKELFMKNPKEQYCYIINKTMELYMNKENEVVYGDMDKEVQVTGDYYQKLKEAGLAFSYEEMKQKENLVLIEE